MSKLIEMGKQYKTRSGLPVRVLCTDYTGGGTNFTVVAAMEEGIIQCTPDGRYFNSEDDHQYDLVEQPQEIVVWVEVFKSYGDILSCSYETEGAMKRSIADSQEQNDEESYQLIATKRVDITEGEMS